MNGRIAALHLWALPLEARFGGIESPWDPTTPAAVRAEVRGRWILEAVSIGAMAAGVRPGTTLSEAKARLPELVVKDRDRAAELRALARAAELLFAFGPVVEVCAPDVLFVEIGRSEKALMRRLHLRDPSTEAFERAVVAELEATLARAGHAATVVLGQTPDATRSLAQHLAEVGLPKPPAPRRVRGRGRGRGVSALPKRPARVRVPKTPRTLIVPPGGEARALSRLPLTALTWTDARQDPDGVQAERLRGALSSLRVLGVHDVERLAAMPADQIASRFGEAGHLLMERALARVDRPLKVFRPPDRLEERAELEHVTEDLEPVLFVLQGLMSRLADRLDARALSVRTVELAFLVEPGLGHCIDAQAERKKSSKWVEKVPLRFARPTRKLKTMLTLAQDRLGGALPGAVRSLTVTAISPHADHGAQLDLFNAHERRLEAVGELVSRLQATLGEAAVFSPEVKNTHRPEAAWRAKAFDIDAALRPRAEEKPRRVVVDASAPDAFAREASPDAYRLPEVGGASVTGLAGRDGVLADDEAVIQAADPAKARPWPKPVPREPADEPLAPLPPRPMALLPRPERATMLRESGMDEGVLVWRGRRHHLVGLGGHEKLEAEWWTDAPVEREYLVAEAADGRRLWIFLTPEGEARVHGIFD